ncbi:mitotic spindle checkpoint protein BUBR1 isoform X2 [Malania oleifera]|nr:mitotic spindle checkpoint protein BUBR1 isoform X2 [Malania oleifera]
MEDHLGSLDPETEFLYSNRETGHEWELFKENVRPLKRGRNVGLLNHALKCNIDNQVKNSLLHTRRRLIQAIDEYEGDDPLHPWIECIKWVQEAFPPGGDCSGLVVIYEQCVRTFWHSDRYKDDLRYLKVWLEYAENCVDAEVIYKFLDANNIGQMHSVYFISYALHMESKNKNKKANDIYNLGISRNAKPIDKLEAAYRKFLAHSMGRPRMVDEDSAENRLPVRSFGTVLNKGENKRLAQQNSDLARKKLKADRSRLAPLSVYKDTSLNFPSGLPADLSKTDLKSWHTLGPQAERNKENNALPSKWTAYKVPQRPVSRTGGATASARIEVFVDEECSERKKVESEGEKSSALQLEQGDIQNLKK